jgi:hypothetical protein
VPEENRPVYDLVKPFAVEDFGRIWSTLNGYIISGVFPIFWEAPEILGVVDQYLIHGAEVSQLNSFVNTSKFKKMKAGQELVR